MDLKMMSQKPFESVQTSIGKLFLFRLRAKDLIEIKDKIRYVDKFESKEFFLFYLPLFAYLKKDLIGEDLERPDEYTLIDEDIKALSEEDCEKIAELFVEENSYLCKDFKRVEVKNEDGSSSTTTEQYPDKSLLKKDNKTYVEYFYRLMKAQEEDRKKLLKKLLPNFSTSLSERILETNRISKKINNSLQSVVPIFGAVNKLSKVTTPPIQSTPVPKDWASDIAKIANDKEKRSLAPLKDLVLRMDDMIKVGNQTAELSNSIYQVHLQALKDQNSFNASANKKTKSIIWLTVISILISVIIWLKNDSINLVKANKNINTSIVETNIKLGKLTEILIEQDRVRSKYIKDLQQEIHNNKSSILKLKKTKQINNSK